MLCKQALVGEAQNSGRCHKHESPVGAGGTANYRVCTRAGLWERVTGRQQRVGLMAQGLQRSLDTQGRVGALKQPSDVLVAALGPSVSVFLSDVETVRHTGLGP